MPALADLGDILLGGLIAVLGFIVVLVVCVALLGLLAHVLPPPAQRPEGSTAAEGDED